MSDQMLALTASVPSLSMTIRQTGNKVDDSADLWK
jgi:hypothetical protein